MVKQRMTSADVAAEVACLRQRILGLRVSNIYDLTPKVGEPDASGGKNRRRGHAACIHAPHCTSHAHTGALHVLADVLACAHASFWRHVWHAGLAWGQVAASSGGAHATMHAWVVARAACMHACAPGRRLGCGGLRRPGATRLACGRQRCMHRASPLHTTTSRLLAASSPAAAPVRRHRRTS